MPLASSGKFALAALGLAGFLALPARADTLSEFYANNRITLIVPTTAGGGYDLPTRILARHFGRHVPGNPTIIVQNMPGAGGKRAISWVYNIAPKDGTVVSAAHAFIAFDPLFEGPTSEAKFDARKFNWLGSIARTNSVGIAWHTSGITSHKDLFEKELVVGGVGIATPMVTHPNLLRGLLGMKFKVVVGYLSGSEVDLAMLRGELQGRIDYTWFGLKEGQPDWLADKKVNLLFQWGLSKARDLPDLPLAMDLARNEEERRILETVSLSYEFGRPYITPPQLPADRLAALRQAFTSTMADPAFVEESRKAKIEIDPVPPERLASLVDRAYELPASLIARITSLQNPKGEVTQVSFKTVRATLGAAGPRNQFAIQHLGTGLSETIIANPDNTAITISAKKAEAKDLKPGMTCAIAYLGDRTTAASIACD